MPLSLTKKKSIIVTFVTCCHVSIHCYSLFILCGVFWYGAWPGWKCDVCVKNKMTHVQIAHCPALVWLIQIQWCQQQSKLHTVHGARLNILSLVSLTHNNYSNHKDRPTKLSLPLAKLTNLSSEWKVGWFCTCR